MGFKQRMHGNEPVKFGAILWFDGSLDQNHAQECGPSGGIDQQIQVASLMVMPVNHRAEDANVPDAIAERNGQLGVPLCLESFRWFHAFSSWSRNFAY